MAQAKWLKVGAALFLSAGMLAACGDGDDGDIEFEAPNLDADVGEDGNEAPEVDDSEDGTGTEMTPEGEEDVETDEELEEEMGGSGS